jgi:hypothetical protein
VRAEERKGLLASHLNSALYNTPAVQVLHCALVGDRQCGDHQCRIISILQSQVVLKNNKSSLSTTVDAGVSEVFLKLNPNDLAENFQVQVGPVSQSGTGDFSPPVNLSLPTSGLPISVQPNLAEVESTAWLLVLLVSLATLLLLLTSLTFYYRRRKAPAPVTCRLQLMISSITARPGPGSSGVRGTGSRRTVRRTPPPATRSCSTPPPASPQSTATPSRRAGRDTRCFNLHTLPPTLSMILT